MAHNAFSMFKVQGPKFNKSVNIYTLVQILHFVKLLKIL